MKKAILTGATGFVGYHLLKYLVKSEIETWVVLRENNPNMEKIKKIKNVNVIECNLENIIQLDDKIKEREFDVFFHLAWEGASGEARQQYTLQMDNAKWTAQCVEVAKKLACKKIIVTGTVCERQCNEIDFTNSFVRASNYLLSKEWARSMAFNVGKCFDIPVVWCQFYHPIGIFNKRNQVITNTVDKILKNEPLKFGKCESFFDVIDVEDLVRGLILLAEKIDKSDICFIGSGKPRQLKNYLLSISNIIGIEAEISFSDQNRDDLYIDKSWLSIERIKKDIDFMPYKSFESSVLEIKDWLNNEDKYNAEKWNF